MFFRNVIVQVLIASIALCQQPVAQPDKDKDEDADSGDLTITILKGEDGVNIVKDQTFAETIVEVRDKNDLPVAGAVVTFFVLKGAAGGKFANGTTQLSATTGSDGQAMAQGLRPAGKGALKLQVRASYQGHTVTTTVAQTNFATIAAATKAGAVAGSSHGAAAVSSATAGTSGTAVGGATAGGLSGLAIGGIVVGVAAGVAAVAKIATGSKSSSSSSGNSSPSVSGTIGGPGTPVFGGPHVSIHH